MSSATHSFPVRVYYEDTDMAGIVYYANYLKYIERARSAWVREMGIDQNEMREKDGVVFAVRRVEADYLSSARFDDELEVRTTTQAVTGARLVMDQQVLRGEEVLFAAQVTIVCIGEGGAPARLPEGLRRRLH
ncbi:tol-pal system-associated acyl-CoA thioesterase [Roseovarius sp. MMSF_3281]|uniref:tol-pal system-associated acyl-CoA thioesterase n=1 Tax=Roseovarius sp. MMSF_3281 TaxID=3046694 RepID=UPI00273E024F|nr:tol-pal system-associated acyl-CoA thioesterase [Roseovarius sp. MMSF_3281]